MENIIPTVGVLTFSNNQVLLVSHTQKADHLNDSKGLPGGRLNEDESEIEAAIKELEEETGYIALAQDLIELPQTYSAKIPRKGGVKNFSLKVFLCLKYSGDLRPSDETIPLWIDLSQLNNLNLLPNTYEAINQGINYKKQ